MSRKVHLSSCPWRISGVESIIFDKDGTLIDLHHYWAEVVRLRVEATIRFYNLDPAYFTDLCRSMGLDLETERIMAEGPIGLAPRSDVVLALHQGLVNSGCKAEINDLVRIFDAVQEQHAHDLVKSARALPGAIDFVRSVHSAGVRLAVVTSDSAANAKLCLEAIGLVDLFSSVVGRDSIREPKKTGHPARMALSELGCDSASAICIGDAPMDALMSAASECRAFIGVATGQTLEKDLQELTPFTVSSLANVQVLHD